MALPIPVDTSSLLSELRDIAILAVIFCYIFAAGRIADFLQQSGKSIKKKEMLVAPFAYVFVSFFGILIYFSSGAWVPPQNTIITMGVYLVVAPLCISWLLGALVLHGFFHDRMNALKSLDLSMRIVLAPLFDGLHGYWVGIGAAALLVAISGVSFWSSGGNFSLITLDFLLLSLVAALYFVYRSAVSKSNEDRASNVLTALVLFAPGALRLFFRDIVCSLLSLIPLQFFKTCPLLTTGNEVTLALSVLATLVLILPLIPLFYALLVNALRVLTAITVLLKKEAPGGYDGERKD